MTMGELEKMTTMWQQAHFGAVMSGSLQLFCASSDKNRVEEEAKCSSQEGDPMEVWRFCLDDVRGLVYTTQKVTILPFSMVSMYMQTPMWKDTICEFMCSWSWHQVPSCWQQWYHANLWRTTSRVLKGTNLPAQLGCPCHGNPHKSCGWRGCPCEPSATGSPPNQDYWRVKKNPKKDGSWML